MFIKDTNFNEKKENDTQKGKTKCFGGSFIKDVVFRFSGKSEFFYSNVYGFIGLI